MCIMYTSDEQNWRPQPKMSEALPTYEINKKKT